MYYGEPLFMGHVWNYQPRPYRVGKSPDVQVGQKELVTEPTNTEAATHDNFDGKMGSVRK